MLIQLILSVFIFAFVPLAIKYTSATPMTICLFRLMITVFILTLFWRKKILFHKFFPKSSGFWRLWMMGIVFFAHWITYVYAVKIGGAGIAVLGMSTYGIQLIVASTLFLGHRISKKDFLCLGFSLIGLAMILPSWSFSNRATQGLILALLSASCFAILPILHRKNGELNTETRIFAQFFGAMICFLFFIGKTSWQLAVLDWWCLVFLAFLGTLVAHGLWAHISSKLSPSVTGLVYYSIAPMTILFSALLLGEKYSIVQLFGACIVIASAMFNIWSFI